MANKPDERLIILLPPELLEEVRRAAEEEDLSVSQIVRRALRNELKAIGQKAIPGLAITLENIGRLFEDARNKGVLTGSVTHGELVPGAPVVRGKLVPNPAFYGEEVRTEKPPIVRKKPRFRI
jgi:hypothetical protein